MNKKKRIPLAMKKSDACKDVPETINICIYDKNKSEDDS